MASSYVNNLRLNEMATGDASGTWGTNTNTNLVLIGDALGFGTVNISSDANQDETVLDGGTDTARSMFIKVTSTTLTATRTLTILPNTMKRVHIIENATTGSQSITIKQGSGATVTIPNGQTKVVYLDGGGSSAAVVDAFTDLNLGGTTITDDLTVSDDLTVNGDIDLEGSIDVNGTTETDALSINGTSVTSTATELNLLDGSTANTVVNSKAVIYGASGELAGTLSTAAQTNITSLGTLTSLTVDDITLNGSELSDAGAFTMTVGALTIDATNDITLDAGGQNILFKDDGTEFGQIYQASNDMHLLTSINNADFKIQGTDNNSTITACTFDMSAAGAATFNNDVTAFSDRRLKSDVSNIENGLEKVMQMQGVYYKRIDDDDRIKVGVIAQDMEEIVPEVVLTADDEMQTKSVDYGKLTAVLIEAIKDLKSEIDELKKG